MKPSILLVNPPIYDFTAFDFWIKPFGMLSAAGMLRGKADFTLFDYLDRLHPVMESLPACRSDKFGKGKYISQRTPKPDPLKNIPRNFQRFGLPRELFLTHLQETKPYDYVFIQTTMTYWYPGICEVIEDLRRFHPNAKIVLGGNYAAICPDHAKSLGADYVLTSFDLQKLADWMSLNFDLSQPPLWEIYPKLKTAVMRLTDGCPFKCTYCVASKFYSGFSSRNLDQCIANLDLLTKLEVEHIAFYDDALLHQPQSILIPFLEHIISKPRKISFHTPNALNARFLTANLAHLMVSAGFKTFYLGFESAADAFQHKTGSKVSSDELQSAVANLLHAGADPDNIFAYQMIGHPHTDLQHLEASMRFVHSLGIRSSLADFSPIPGTPDAQLCESLTDMPEPLCHNKTAFPITLLGFEKVNYFKNLHHELNSSIT